MKSHFKMPDVSEKLKLNLIEFKKQIPRAIHLQKKIRQFNYNSSYPTQVNYWKIFTCGRTALWISIVGVKNEKNIGKFYLSNYDIFHIPIFIMIDFTAKIKKEI